MMTSSKSADKSKNFLRQIDQLHQPYLRDIFYTHRLLVVQEKGIFKEELRAK